MSLTVIPVLCFIKFLHSTKSKADSRTANGYFTHRFLLPVYPGDKILNVYERQEEAHYSWPEFKGRLSLVSASYPGF